MNTPILWEELTAPEIRELSEKVGMAIIVGGATEQHGPHLPECVDWMNSYEIAKRVSARTGVPILPPIKYGESQTHKRLGALWIRPETLHSIVYDVCKSLYHAGFRKILLFPAHGTNTWPFHTAWSNLRFDLPNIQIKIADQTIYQFMSEEDKKIIKKINELDPFQYHAGTSETSLMLAIRPDLVHMDRAVDWPMLMPHGALFDYRVDQISESGVCGRPSKASPVLGEKLINARVNAISKWIELALQEKIPFPD